ncbi:unnamed protein product [Acanthoscelides obtectus]|uniref:CHK kinase-like domain-containing protein n=1 Tax=Acanthoscelides obtectus TaxID=200917 RepID=A0A9P0L3M1_ACAOB|nr:unnamed protein product [Acanthoscelides obtectus]CAK1659767.1 hypothetical protein AOBTE_LOCUS21666 [Acanthoscelides obtectus]
MDEEIQKYVADVASNIFTNFTITVEDVASKDGYLGDLLFVSIHGKTKDKIEKKIDVAVKVAKVLPFDVAVECESVYKQERFFYDEVFPVFESIQKNIKNKFKPYPHCFKCFTERNIIVLENLKAKGYEMIDKDTPMDFDHCRAVIEVFGKFHAMSFALKSRDGQKYDKLAEYSRDLGMKHNKLSYVAMYNASMQEALHLLKKKGDISLSEEIGNVVLMWGNKYCGYQVDDEPQAVLTHGDGWNNNIMFRYDEGNISVKLVDWQLADVRTPIYDICLFLYASCNDFKNFDKLIRIYHNSLTSFLEELNVDPEVFTFEDLQRHLAEYTPYLIMHLPLLLKFVFGDGAFDMNEKNNEIIIGIPQLKEDLFYYRLKSAFKYFYTTYVKQ